MTPWRRWGLASEGALALFIIGANVYMAATFARTTMGWEEPDDGALESHEIAESGAGAHHPREESGVPAPASPDEEDVRADDETAPPGSAADDADVEADEETAHRGSTAGDDEAIPATSGTGRSARTVEAARAFLGPLESTEGKKHSPWEKGPSATLVSFWASWCGPCRHELPLLEELQQQLGPRGFKVVLVNVDLDSADSVRRFLKRSGVRLPSLMDRDQSLFERLGGRALPTSFLLDDRGRPVKGYTGMADPARLSRDISPLLRSSAAEPQEGS
jgi:thiol-disulfide isomerase/thioredoxin